MKKRILICGAILLLVTGLSAFQTKIVSAITGKITPGDGVEVIWAVSGKDTVKAVPVPVMGAFSIEVKPGTYTLFIIAKAPYKNAQVANVKVDEEQTVDVGEINLSP